MKDAGQKFIAGRTKGNSMWPWIREDNLLFIKPVNWKQISPGDIIVYSDDLKDIWIAHRVIKKELHYLITKGDAVLSLRKNEKVPQSKLVGKAIFVQSRSGKILDLRYTKFTYYLNRYFPPLWWIIYGLIKYKLSFLFFTRVIKKIQRIF